MPAAIVAGERITACLNSPEGTAMTSGNRTSLRIAAAAMASEVPAAGALAPAASASAGVGAAPARAGGHRDRHRIAGRDG